MQEGEEPDTCRICSAPAEPDQPLFHPCKCSGTIRYIHQDCLTTWLAHSKKKTCDVCKHPYSFTKVYAPDMPSHIPPLLLARRILQQSLFGVLFVLRLILVAIIWLAFLPWVTVWTWRMYFAMGETTAWWISDRPRPMLEESPSNSTAPAHSLFHKFRYQLMTNSSSLSTNNFIERIATHPAWVSLSADIFTGQIIAALIVLTFVAIFLLREWITQNARPGLFDDDMNDLAGVEDPVNLPPPPPPPEPLQRMDPPEIEGFPEADLARRQQQAIRVMDAFRMQEKHHPPQLATHQNRPIEDIVRPPRAKGPDEVLKRARFGDVTTIEQGVPIARVLRPDQKRRARLAAAASASKAKTRDEGGSNQTFGNEKGKFTFSFPLQSPTAESSQETEPDESSFVPGPISSGSEIPFGTQSWTTSSPTWSTATASSNTIPPDPTSGLNLPELGPSTSIPFTPTWIPPWAAPVESGPSSTAASDADPETSNGPSTEPPVASTSSSATAPPPSLPQFAPFANSPFVVGAPSPQRPPLPSSVFPSPSSEHVPGAKSPGLATYRPPEEPLFEQTDYFEGHKSFVKPPPRVVQPEDPAIRDARKRRELGKREWNALMADDKNEDEESSDSASEEEDGEISMKQRSNGKGKAPQTYQQHEDEEDEADEMGDDQYGDNIPDHEFEHHGVWDDDDDEATGSSGEGEGRDMDIYFRDVEEPNDALRRMLAGPGDGAHENGMEDDNEDVLPAMLNARARVVDDRPPEDDVAGNEIADGEGDGFGPDMNDDMEGGVEDDMEGAMEAIGMRGPIHGVLQNAALMIFVLDTAIGLCIWIPFTIGKTTALLSLNPPRLLQILHLPIKAMRLLTDPVVDLVVFLVTRFIIPPILDVGKGWVNLTILAVQTLLGKKVAQGVAKACHSLYDQSRDFLHEPISRLLFPPASNVTVSPVQSEHIFPAFAQPLESHFEVLGRHVRLTGEKAQGSWIRLALGHGPAERVFATFLGYVVVGLMLAAYLNVLTVGNARTAGRAVRNVVRQQLLVLKVAAFIFIELAVFPLGCGIILDICTVWLFPEANLLSRVAFFTQAPLTAIFYHWVAGTMFMYSFAVLLSGCRTVMRPGAMWFIKDPQDQNSHPIRDILERPTFLQLRKILASAVMYSIVVAAVVGSVAGLLLLGSKSIMPFRWKTREPLSSVPVDLLFLHLILPQTLLYFRPRRAMKAVTTRVWRALATKLRLTSYFFGGRYPAEEFTSDKWAFPWSPVEEDAENYRIDGTFRRVPATDHLALPRDMKATAEVTAEGWPVDEENARLFENQNEEARKAKHEIEKDYMVVFIPSHFRYRIIGFMLLLWSIGALFVGISVALPVQLGRSFFTLFTTREVHDGYSFIVGFYCLWACYLVGRAVDRLERQHRRSAEAFGAKGPRKDVRVMAAKRFLFNASKMAYLGFFLGFVIPILLAFVMDLYVVLPIRSAFSPGETPRIRVVDNWALGLLYGKIFMHIARVQRNHPMMADVQRILDRGWMAIDPVEATIGVIAPLTAGLVGMIILPALLLQVGRLVLARVGINASFMYMNIYPTIFVFVAFVRLGFVVYDVLSGWSQSIRDKEFLVELRLKNHDPEARDDSSPDDSLDERTRIAREDEALDAVEELQQD